MGYGDSWGYYPPKSTPRKVKGGIKGEEQARWDRRHLVV